MLSATPYLVSDVSGHCPPETEIAPGSVVQPTLGPRHHSWHDLSFRQTKATEITMKLPTLKMASKRIQMQKPKVAILELHQKPFADVMAKLLVA